MANLTGTAGADTLNGTALDDIISGLAGNDSLFDRLGGNDSLVGGDGNDSLGIERTIASAAGTSTASLDGGNDNDQISVIANVADRRVTATIAGGGGDDQVIVGGFVIATIDAGTGNDRITLGSRDAATITLGSGTDSIQVLLDAGALPIAPWIITDFAAGAGGDVLKLGDWLATALVGWDQFNPFAGGFLRVLQSGSNALVQVDTDGGGNGYASVFILNNVTAASLTAANFDGFGPDGSPAVGITINGTAGNDTLSGTFGGDTIFGNGGADSIASGAGDDHVIIGSGTGIVTGGTQNDFLEGGAGNDNLNGQEGNDRLDGNGGDDLLFDTGGGVDILDGGSGNDALILVREVGEAGTLSAIGGLGDDTIRYTGVNIGTVTIDGGDGRDTVQLIDARGSFVITLGTGQDKLLLGRNAGTDLAARTIAITDFGTGNSGDVIQFSGLIDAALTNWDRTSNPFGTGHMRLLQDGANVRLQVDLDGGNNSFQDLVILQNTQAAALTAFNLEGWPANGSVPAGLSLTGTENADSLTGGPGADVITLLGGADLAFGGAGADRIEGGDGDDRISGDGGDDVLFGGNGIDTLNGGSGVDLLDGGAGNDFYVLDTQADLAFEAVGGGIDTIIATTGFYLYANIENLILEASAGDIFGVGNELANTMTGNQGSNLLLGGLGNDVISGGAGIDSLFGEGGNDTLNGDAGIDYLVGGIGNDTLNGGDNPDALYGEAGDDILDGGTSFDTDILVGGDGSDQLFGNSGLGDYDLMNGAAGSDTYHVDTPDDLTFEALNGGTDTIFANIVGAGYYLYANTENLTLLGQTPFGVGNELANVLTGNGIGNYLLGGLGNDTLNGKAGNDVLFGEGGADTFIFERGTGGDVIGDFQAGIDKISLVGLGVSNFAQVQAAFIENGGTTGINLGQGDLIVINGVANAALTAGDFLFG